MHACKGHTCFLCFIQYCYKLYNHWRLKYIRSDDTFYGYYFRAVRKVSVMYNTTKQTLLLSGDVELNPGPLTDNTINDQVSHDHRSYERNLSNCVKKPEKVWTSTGFEPVTSQ